MWGAIAKESNAYRVEGIPAVAKAQRDKQLQAQLRDPVKSAQPLEVLEQKLRKVKPIQAHEFFT
ncbi:hypothetical protein F441_20052 [Phytophthora nicotianae CJ01A1]|nr:hypothetical protein F441_20052 [Phytophthora nicotianae CJ01A1]